MVSSKQWASTGELVDQVLLTVLCLRHGNLTTAAKEQAQLLEWLGLLSLENTLLYSHISLTKGSKLAYTLCSLYIELGIPDNESPEKAGLLSCIPRCPSALGPG